MVAQTCTFDTENNKCIKLNQNDSTSYCQIKEFVQGIKKSIWAECDEGCFEPSVGRSDISICRSAETKCKFPFKHNGKTYQKCTKVSISKTCKNCIEEDFFWCATQIDQSGHMKMWGKCDTSTCDLNSGILGVLC